jgi:Bacterial capsule synthesis protein PGA_cap
VGFVANNPNYPVPGIATLGLTLLASSSASDKDLYTKLRLLPVNASSPVFRVNASPELNSAEATVLFAGDFYVRPDHTVADQGALFSPETAAVIRESTFSIVNFEGTLRPAGSKGIDKEGPHLALHSDAPALLRSVGFHAICLANNHAMDYGAEALRHTIEISEKCGLLYAGAGLNSHHASQSLKVCLPSGVRMQILSFCEREFGISAKDSPGTAWIGAPQVEDKIRYAKQESDLVIVCAHGGNELMPVPSSQRRDQLRRLVDAGADLVIGHHPHVPQGWEQYAGHYIFYSLGDFYFDSIDGRRYEYRDWGFMVRVHIDERRISTLEIIPYERVRNCVVPLGNQRDAAPRLAYLDELSNILGSPQFEGYWQQLAVDRLPSYRQYLGSRLPGNSAPFRQRLHDVLRTLHDMCDLFTVTEVSQTSRSSDCTKSRATTKALGALNVIRCESHRWALETALAVLAGDCEDLRTPEIKNKLESMAPFYGEGYF